MSPLQKQATQTQRLLGSVEEKLEQAQALLNEHEKRLTKLENR